MEISFEIAGFSASEGAAQQLAKDFNVADMGICCPFKVIRPDGYFVGVAWPLFDSHGVISVGSVAFDHPEGGLTKAQINATWRHNHVALCSEVAKHFKSWAEGG